MAGIFELVAQPSAGTVALDILAGPVVKAGKAEPAGIGQLEGTADAELTISANATGRDITTALKIKRTRSKKRPG